MTQQYENLCQIEVLGFSRDDAHAIRRIAMTLHRWHERECGIDNGCIERDETTGIPNWLNSHTMRRSRIRDMEHGACKRLHAILARYPGLRAYQQTDPRGASLYLYRADALGTRDIQSCYSSIGIAVHDA